MSCYKCVYLYVCACVGVCHKCVCVCVCVKVSTFLSLRSLQNEQQTKFMWHTFYVEDVARIP